MFELWIGNEFPIDLILDLGNYSFFCLIFYFIYKKKLITQNEFFILCILMCTPFLFNNGFLTWQLSPDQSKYFSISHTIREDMSLKHLYEAKINLKMVFASYIFAYSPLLNIETFKSIGFLNRFIFLSSTLFFYKKKKISYLIFLIAILSPSLTYFTSISLREGLIFASMIWSVFFFLEKKYFLLLIALLILLVIKVQNLLIVLILIYAYLLFQSKNKKFFFLSLFLLAASLIYSADELIYKINELRKGFYFEEHGKYRGITSASVYNDISLNLDLIIIYIKSFANFFISPLLNMDGKLKFIIFYEILILYLFFLKDIFVLRNFKLRNIFYLWIFIFFISFSAYSLIVFNDGSIHRYRIILIFFILYGYNMHKLKFFKK